jgi:putative ABC transport system permease protein
MFPRDEGYSDAQGKIMYEKVRAAVSSMPGVESVTISNNLPLFAGSSAPVRLARGDKPTAVGSSIIDENYFRTFGIPVLEGRGFQPSDTAPDRDVVVISRQMAEKFWPGQVAVGRGLMTGDPPRQAVVVGVAGDVKYDDLGGKAQPYFYYALSQHYDSGVSVIARTKGDPRLWMAQMAKAVRGAGFQSPTTPITFANIENLSLLPQRVVSGFAQALSGLGLLLAIAGLFGAISYSVSERKKELGLRVALGARPWQLMKMVFRQTLSVAGAGTVIGIVLGIGITIVVRSLLYDIGAVEWTVLVPVGVAMVGISLLVAYLSARPWLSVDPMEAVRHA